MSYESVAQCSCDATAAAFVVESAVLNRLREGASEVKERPGQVDNVKGASQGSTYVIDDFFLGKQQDMS
jgi:hypothetical protein